MSGQENNNPLLAFIASGEMQSRLQGLDRRSRFPLMKLTEMLEYLPSDERQLIRASFVTGTILASAYHTYGRNIDIAQSIYYDFDELLGFKFPISRKEIGFCEKEVLRVLHEMGTPAQFFASKGIKKDVLDFTPIEDPLAFAGRVKSPDDYGFEKFFVAESKVRFLGLQSRIEGMDSLDENEVSMREYVGKDILGREYLRKVFLPEWERAYREVEGTPYHIDRTIQEDLELLEMSSLDKAHKALEPDDLRFTLGYPGGLLAHALSKNLMRRYTKQILAA